MKENCSDQNSDQNTDERFPRLTHGPGNGETEACLLTASNMVIGHGDQMDFNRSVCSVISHFGVLTNDEIPLHLLGRLYGDLPWEILGTSTGDLVVMEQRAFYALDRMVRDAMPRILDLGSFLKEAEVLRKLAPLTDKPCLDDGYEAIDQVYKNVTAQRSSDCTRFAVIAVRESVGELADQVDCGAVLPPTRVAESVAEALLVAVSHAAHYWDSAGYLGHANELWEIFPSIIRGMAEIGERNPPETVLSRKQLCDMLES